MILWDIRERAVETLNIFIKVLVLSRQKEKLQLSPGTFTAELQQDLHNCLELVLLSNASGVPQLKIGKKNVIFFFLSMFNPPPEPDGVGWILKY